MRPDTVDAFAERSGSASLHIDSVNEERVVDLLTAHMSRISTLQLILGLPASTLLLDALCLPAPLVTKLKFWPLDLASMLPEGLFGGHAPRLRTLSVYYGARLPSACPALRTVVNFFADVIRPPTEPAPLSELMPRLETLSLTNVLRTNAPHFSLHPTHALRNLVISAWQPRSRNAARLINPVHAGHLIAANHAAAGRLTIHRADAHTLALVIDSLPDAEVVTFAAAKCSTVAAFFAARSRFAGVRTFRCASQHLAHAPTALPDVATLIVDFTREEHDRDLWYKNFRLWLRESVVPALDTLFLSSPSSAYFTINAGRVAEVLGALAAPLRLLEAAGTVFEDEGAKDILGRVVESFSCVSVPTSQPTDPLPLTKSIMYV